RDGDLGAAPGLAGGSADLDDALLDLGHLELEQRFHEQGIGARQDQARALGRLLDALEHDADRIALMEVLAVVRIAVGDDRFGLAELGEHDDDLAARDLLHRAREQLAHLVRELLPDARALALPHALDDALLRSLHGGAAERLERHLLFQYVPRLEVRVLEARLLERHLGAGVLDGLDHGPQHEYPDSSLQYVAPDLLTHVTTITQHLQHVSFLP